MFWFCAVGVAPEESRADTPVICTPPFSGQAYIDCLEQRCESLGVPVATCQQAADACTGSSSNGNCFWQHCGGDTPGYGPRSTPESRACYSAAYYGNITLCTAPACQGADIGTQAPISVSTRMIACVRQTIDVLFNPNQCPTQYIGKNLQKYVAGVVGAVLTLATVLLGIKVMLKGSVSKAEVLTFLFKFGAILWLCLGDGMTNFVYKGAMAILGDLPSFLMGASTGLICNYDPSLYPPEMSYLRTWDIIDCRLAHYLLIGIADQTGTSISGEPTWSYLPFGILEAIFPLTIALQGIIAIIFILLGIFLLSLMANFLYIVVLAMLSLALLTFVGFIFVPMMIFDPTKDIFKKWWQAVLSCALQPAVIAGIMSMVFLVFDKIVYNGCQSNCSSSCTQTTCTNGNCTPGSCTWNCSGGDFQIASSKSGKTTWTIPSKPMPKEPCASSIGYKLFVLMNPASISWMNMILVELPYFDGGMTASDLVSLLKAAVSALLFCYLFMMIASKGSEFASKLTSGPEIGKWAVSASALLDAVMSALNKESPKKGEDEGSGSEGSDKKKEDGKDDGAKRSGAGK